MTATRNHLLTDVPQSRGRRGEREARFTGRLSARHVLLVSGYPPSSCNGGGIILRNLFLGRDGVSLSILTSRRVLEALSGPNGRERAGILPVSHLLAPSLWSRVRGLGRLFRSLNVFLTPLVAFRGSRCVRRDTCIVAVPWGGHLGSELFISSYLIHIITGAPIVVYEMDDWKASLGKASGRVARALERWFHARILKAAASVFVISEGMDNLFRRRYGITPKRLAHSVQVSYYNGGRTGQRANQGTCDILFTGSIYGAHADAILRILRVIQSGTLRQCSRLIIYSASNPADLREMGLDGHGIELRNPILPEQVRDLFASADILLLPFSFAESQQETVSTSFPTKVAEYLASGVPILVHAPEYSTIAKAAKAGAWGEVVDQADDVAVATAIDRLASDTELRTRLAARALREAREHFDVEKSRAEFLAVIENADRKHRSAYVL